MSTAYSGSSGFNLPGIDYTLTKPNDLVGTIGKGMALGNSVLDIPNDNRARQLVSDQQKAVQGGGLTMASAKLDNMLREGSVPDLPVS